MSALAIWCFALITPSIAQMDDGGRNGFLRTRRDERFVRGLQTSSVDDMATGSAIPPMVGIGFDQSNDAADVVPATSDSELVEELEDDDRVTVQSIQLGELLCDSLENAEDAPRLQFAITPDEIITADQTSYMEFNGTIFADGISRKVWTGEVVHDQEEVSSQTASMTWGAACDVETFLLQIATKFMNGTLIVAKTIPCEAGGPFDICIVELEIELPDEGEYDVREIEAEGSENVRRLRDAQVKNEEEFEFDADTGTIKPVRRQLQSTTQIDLMFLYTPGGRDILGVSDPQMQSELADSLVTVNEAMVNSDVDLQFSLVRVEPLPYTEESTTSSAVLDNLEVNSEVAALRDTYGADLVHLVADLGADNFGTCGLAHLPSSPIDIFAFGVVDPYCFFQFSHTHEIAHNMGCYHNRENSNTQQHEYAHGYRYCDGDLPYRTIMSYSCFDENGFLVPRVNYFSNPDITFNGRPTGTPDNDCARRLAETMGDVANYRESTTAPTTPAPTIPITAEPTIPITQEPTIQITPEPTIPITPTPTIPTTPEPTIPITQEPTIPIIPKPMIPITPEPTIPITPEPTIQITPEPTIPITPEPTISITPEPEIPITPEPTTPITLEPTTPITPAPTIPITTEPTIPTTSEPTIPISPEPTIPITPKPTIPITPKPTTPITLEPTTPITPASTISINLGPTIPITPEPTRDPTSCSNGITGVERDGYCCALGCGTCGGFSCSQRAREAGLTSEDCCVTLIDESGVYCDNSGMAPCIFGEGPSPAPITIAPTLPITPEPTTPITQEPTTPITPKPTIPITPEPTIPITSDPTTPITPEPTIPITSEPTIPITPEPTRDPTSCSNGITGVERDGYCCVLGCGTCGGFSCSQRAREAGLTSEDCCVTLIDESGVYCDNSGTAPCIFGEAPTSAARPATLEPTSRTPVPEFATLEPSSTLITTGLVEAGERTTVVVRANGYDERTSGYGCAPDGCVAANTRDGALFTRWACKESLLSGVNCEITFEFGEPQNLDVMRVAFYKGTERTRKLKVKINGSTYTEIVSSGQSDDFEDFELGVDGASEVTLEGLELGSEDWIALTEVQLIVP